MTIKLRPEQHATRRERILQMLYAKGVVGRGRQSLLDLLMSRSELDWQTLIAQAIAKNPTWITKQ
jgi:predicted metal-dependent peptidase